MATRGLNNAIIENDSARTQCAGLTRMRSSSFLPSQSSREADYMVKSLQRHDS